MEVDRHETFARNVRLSAMSLISSPRSFGSLEIVSELRGTSLSILSLLLSSTALIFASPLVESSVTFCDEPATTVLGSAASNVESKT